MRFPKLNTIATILKWSAIATGVVWGMITFFSIGLILTAPIPSMLIVVPIEISATIIAGTYIIIFIALSELILIRWEGFHIYQKEFRENLRNMGIKTSISGTVKTGRRINIVPQDNPEETKQAIKDAAQGIFSTILFNDGSIAKLEAPPYPVPYTNPLEVAIGVNLWRLRERILMELEHHHPEWDITKTVVKTLTIDPETNEVRCENILLLPENITTRQEKIGVIINIPKEGKSLAFDFETQTEEITKTGTCSSKRWRHIVGPRIHDVYCHWLRGIPPIYS
jgi:hypothetical protein